MITVGVRDLKSRLSQYLQYVKDGEKVIVTEHDKIIAEINMPQNEAKVSLNEELAKLSREGRVILAKRQQSYVTLPEIKEKLDWESVYREIRGDRI